ncbi:hypothetical protein Bca101_015921 [Brassica carinata]
MASNQLIAFYVIVTLLLHGNNNTVVQAQLRADFYSKSCPGLDSVVRTAVNFATSVNHRMGASLLRLFYLDCFVNRCAASILLDDTSSFTGEQNAASNRNSARGFNVIDNIKSAVELVCPGVVSCADILAIAARDSVVFVSFLCHLLVRWQLYLGRRDARTASQAAANSSIPAVTSSLSELISSFGKLGFTFTPRERWLLSPARTRSDMPSAETSEQGSPGSAEALKLICPRTSGDGYLATLDFRREFAFGYVQDEST